MPSPPAEPEIAIVVPGLGLSPVHVSAWFAEPGDGVYQGDRLVEVRAGAATFDVSAPATGRLVKQLVWPGDEVQPGQVLGFIVTGPPA